MYGSVSNHTRPENWIAGITLGLTCLSTLVLLGPSASAAEKPKYAIAFASFRPLNAKIFIADRDGANPKAFEPAGFLDINASFSKDGKWIVFTSDRAGSADIYRARVDGTGLERLTADPAFDDQAALSPDGRSLAFVSTRAGGLADIWIEDIATKIAHNLTPEPRGHFRPAWSPDGEWIAFSSDRDSPMPRRPGSFEFIERTEIYVMRRDGSGLRQITHTGGVAGSPQWSPNGKQIAFYQCGFEDVIRISDPRRQRGTCQIATVGIEGGMVQVRTTGAGEKWSPHWIGGNRIGYSTGGPGGGIEFVGGEAGHRGEFNSPDWSADGKQMVYYRDIGEDWPPVREVWSKDPEFRLIRTGIFPSYSPSGDRLVVTSAYAAAMHNGLIESSADGTNRWAIFDDQMQSVVAPMWSPRGDWIAFGAGGAFQNSIGVGKVVSHLALISPEGTGFKLLTTGDGNDNFPSWSPDGHRLVYRTQDDQGKGLRIIDIQTGRITTLTTGGHNSDNFPSWSPNGDQIVFLSNREDGNYEIYVIHPDGSGLKRITHLPGNNGHPVFSPDGKWIVFATGASGFKDETPLHPHNPQSYGEIAVMRPDGSGMRMLSDNCWEDSTPRWLPLSHTN